ncbi:hypothetical protein OPQ81_003429 [Rhizoctonia solani]|nr:hypothetical protein OPQ81_003429 [Rhizoctonia solani]
MAEGYPPDQHEYELVSCFSFIHLLIRPCSVNLGNLKIYLLTEEVNSNTCSWSYCDPAILFVSARYCSKYLTTRGQKAAIGWAYS